MKVKFIISLFTLVGLFYACKKDTSIDQLNLGLIGYYPFNGDANDNSGFNNNAKVFGATLTSDRFGNESAAYYFNGTTDYIKIENDTILNATNFTYSLWVKFQSLPLVNNSECLLEIGSIPSFGTYYGQIISLNNQYSNMSGWVVSSGHIDGTRILMSDQNNEFPNLEDWYNIVLIRDNDQVSLYIDKQLIFSQITNNLQPFFHKPLDVYIGSRCQLLQYFNGMIDDIRIYDRALSFSEIAMLFNKK